MARKSNSLNPAMYGLTQQDVERVIRIHSMCKDMDEDAFEQMETAAESIKLVSSLKQLAGRPVACRGLDYGKDPVPHHAG